MTLDVYSDLFDGDLDLFADRLEAVHSRPADFLRTQSLGEALRLAQIRCTNPVTCANVVPPARFELATPALGERCSIP